MSLSVPTLLCVFAHAYMWSAVLVATSVRVEVIKIMWASRPSSSLVTRRPGVCSFLGQLLFLYSSISSTT